MSLIAELKRRNVFRVAAAYVVAAWVITEVSSLVLEIYESPDSVIRIIVALLALGLPFALVFAWAFEATPEGIKRESEVDRPHSVSDQTAKRLDVLTIGLVVVAVLIFSVDQFLLDRFQEASVPNIVGGPDSAEHASTTTSTNSDKGRDIVWATRQLVEIDRLRDLGENGAAFALAREVAPLLDGDYDVEEFWSGYSWSTDIDSEPAGARVYRQHIDAAEDEWEDLGTTPLKTVRFPIDQAYRVRFELDGHRSVELLHEALFGADWRGVPAVNPVRMDRVDDLPEEMVRISGFTHDLVEYGDFFMDRFEVTNRDYARFVTSGGYQKPEYWPNTFVKDGKEIAWEDAVSSFVDRTNRPGPSTWSGGAYPSDEGNHPVSGVSWYEAAAYARFVEKELPTRVHQDQGHRFYFENSGFVAPRSNFEGDGPWPVGENRAMTTMGVYDLIGNVREWCWNEVGTDARCTNGAAWNDAPYNATNIIPKSPWDRDSTNGFRLVRTFDSDEKVARLQQPEVPLQRRDLRSEEPASDAEFEIYRRMYAYDPLPLNAEVVQVDKFEHWTRERVAFDLPYRGRGAAMLYLPKNVAAPYETVIYWPGSDALAYQSIEEEYLESFDFLMKSGRAVAQPIFLGTFGRDDPGSRFNENNFWLTPDWTKSTTYRDRRINWVQELSRTIDYLESRDDIDADRLGYYGYSWGGLAAPIVLVVEEQRFDAAVLNVGGLDDSQQYLPEVDPINFVTRVRTPVLMINGEYDIVVPLETSQKPMIELLGTDPEHKRLHVTPAAHLVPEDVLIRETLDWFDRYLREQGN
ncbi:MAG: SUMF1/EgtB/PvdO family nonheme iron enzyme [Gemmatimonadetes bacterium]|nr:SUMF1/EgtB/PvdO family nonheme iron enzyme [Gemmatimonadota bacterium]